MGKGTNAHNLLKEGQMEYNRWAKVWAKLRGLISKRIWSPVLKGVCHTILSSMIVNSVILGFHMCTMWVLRVLCARDSYLFVVARKAIFQCWAFQEQALVAI